MPCFTPLQAYASKALTDRGRRKPVFNCRDGFIDMPMLLPCGQCIGCRFKRSRDWALRCMAERSLHQQSCFITLTYDNDHLPPGGGLQKWHWVNFMKRLRKRFGNGIRFYMCGEYGDKFGRPHFHAIIFGLDFMDKQFLTQTKSGGQIFRSQSLEKLWTFGFSSVGAATFQSAAYVARYIMKKITGKQAADHYRRFDSETGEIFDIQPEYNSMSRRNGIAYDWFKSYKSEIYPDDFVVINGQKFSPPKYFDNLFDVEFPAEMDNIKRLRKLRVVKHSPERLEQLREVFVSKMSKFKRNSLV